MKKLLFLFLAIAVAGCSSDGGSDNGIENTELTTMAAQNITPFSANIQVNASRDVSEYNIGVMVGTAPNPSINDGVSYFYSGNPTSDTSYSALISGGLEPNTTYYARAVINAESTVYGNQVTFTTAAIINTAAVKNISSQRFSVKINVSPTPGFSVDDRGVVFSTSPNPTISNDEISAGTGGSGEVELSPYWYNTVSPNTVYYLRGYVYINGNYHYGNEVTFRTAGYLGGSGSFVFFDKGSTSDGWRYLEMAPNDIDNSNVFWGCSVFVNGVSNDLGAGLTNTSLIAAACTASNGAARLCQNAVINNKDDWFLPSKDEIDYMYDMKAAGIFNPGSVLWTSSQFSTSEGFALNFSNGNFLMLVKNQYTGARAWPIRRF